MSEAQRTGQAVWVTILVFSLIGLYFYLSQPEYDGGPTRWQRWRARYLMSRTETDHRTEPPLHEDNSTATTTPATSNNGVATPQLDSNALLRVQAVALAKMISAGKVGETEGIRIVFGCAPSSSNPKYIAARAVLKAELAKLNGPEYRPLDDKKQAILN